MAKTKYRKHKGGKSTNRRSKTFKKMNCNPIVEGKTPVAESCFTEDVLEKIKQSYNEQHPTNKITVGAPHLLWHELKSRIQTCDKEDCWLEQIKEATLRKQIDELSFAPDHPSEWKSNPDEWLSNFDILEVLKQYEEKHKHFKFIGPTPIDFDTKPPSKKGKCVWQELCTFSLKEQNGVGKTQIGVVFNLDKHNEDGSHWVSLYIDLNDKFIFFLDSAGDEAPKEVRAFVDRVISQGKEMGISLQFYENAPFEHQMGNTECGMYSLFFLITMLTKKIGKKTYTHSQLIEMFKKKRIPDKYIFNYRKVYFNSN
jgi:hypothetical protein